MSTTLSITDNGVDVALAISDAGDTVTLAITDNATAATFTIEDGSTMPAGGAQGQVIQHLSGAPVYTGTLEDDGLTIDGGLL